MPFLTQGKTNWKFIGIVAVLAVIVSGAALGYIYFLWPKQLAPLPDSIKMEVSEKSKDKISGLKYEIEYPNLENFEGEGDYYYWFLSQGPKVDIYSPSEFIECSEEEGSLILLLEELAINDIQYFLCTFTEGAVGTHYTTYYAFTTKNKEQFILSLTIGKTSCYAYGSPFYPESQFQACEEKYQKAEKKVKELIVQMLSTIRFTEEDKTADTSTGSVQDWQTYRNEEYGFEIKHPIGLVISDKASETANYLLLLYIGSTVSIGIEKAIYTLEQKIEDYRFSPVPNPVDKLEEVVIGKGNYVAKKWSYEGLFPATEPGLKEEIIAFTEYFIEHDGNLYQIHYDIHPLLPKEIFNQMLSTFRFIE